MLEESTDMDSVAVREVGDGAVLGEALELGVAVGGHAHDEFEARLAAADPEEVPARVVGGRRGAIWTHSRTRRTRSRSISRSHQPASATREICAAGPSSGPLQRRTGSPAGEAMSGEPSRLDPSQSLSLGGSRRRGVMRGRSERGEGD